jgi:centrosomal protein CEP104
MSPNDRTGFRARELKSVHVDADGTFLKFILHKNHINKMNLWNQVNQTFDSMGFDIREPTDLFQIYCQGRDCGY